MSLRKNTQDTINCKLQLDFNLVYFRDSHPESLFKKKHLGRKERWFTGWVDELFLWRSIRVAKTASGRVTRLLWTLRFSTVAAGNRHSWPCVSCMDCFFLFFELFFIQKPQGFSSQYWCWVLRGHPLQLCGGLLSGQLSSPLLFAADSTCFGFSLLSLSSHRREPAWLALGPLLGLPVGNCPGSNRGSRKISSICSSSRAHCVLLLGVSALKTLAFYICLLFSLRSQGESGSFHSVLTRSKG